MPASPAQAPSDAPRLPSPDDAAAFDELCADVAALHAPADTHWVEEVAFAMWRQRRLRGIESAALDRAEGMDEPDPTRLAPLAALARYRARVGRDLRLAEAELGAARRSRPHGPAVVPGGDPGTDEPEPGPARRIVAGIGAAGATVRERTNEPAPAPLNRQQRRRLEALTRRLAA